MKTIHKYEIDVANVGSDDSIQVEIPRGHEILHVGQQRSGVICIWAIVDTKNKKDKRRFWVVGTGNPLDGVENERYLGTVHEALLDRDNTLVWHLFTTKI
jgi:hypothetical protein